MGLGRVRTSAFTLCTYAVLKVKRELEIHLFLAL
jgi:hypothetical protein